MKKILFSKALALVFVLSNVMSYAQGGPPPPPDPQVESGGIGGIQTTPIDNYVGLLLLLGIVFILISVKHKFKQINKI